MENVSFILWLETARVQIWVQRVFMCLCLFKKKRFLSIEGLAAVTNKYDEKLQ